MSIYALEVAVSNQNKRYRLPLHAHVAFDLYNGITLICTTKPIALGVWRHDSVCFQILISLTVAAGACTLRRKPWH